MLRLVEQQPFFQTFPADPCCSHLIRGRIVPRAAPRSFTMSGLTGYLSQVIGNLVQCANYGEY
jgi:hypothetical protein